jgi:hypothetical protein
LTYENEIIGDWKEFRNLKLYNLYSSPYIITIIKLREVRLIRHVECIETTINACKIYVQNPNGKSHLKDLGLDGKVRISLFVYVLS